MKHINLRWVVLAHSARSGGQRGYFSIFLNMKVYCVFSLQSPHQGGSNVYTQYFIFNMKNITLYIPNQQLWDFVKGPHERVQPGRVAQSVGHLTRKSGVLGPIPGLATYFCFSFRFFKKGSCQLLAKLCARSTG